MAPISIYTHPICLKHDMGEFHPESPKRLQSILSALQEHFDEDEIHVIESVQVTREQLYRVHDKDYVDGIFGMAPEKDRVQIDPDTAMNPFTLPAALHASGAMVQAVDDVLQGKTQKAACMVRPPGHHAEPHRAMGFCFFNNIAIGAMHAIDKYHCKKIAIVDFDVHHGNGTELMVQNEPKICFWSSFQHPFYPGTTLEGKPPHMHLRPLPAGTGSAAYRKLIKDDLIPLLHDFKPECIFTSAGFDAHRLDPLASLDFETEDYAFITSELRKIADQYSEGRMISTLEGGYNLGALSQSVVAHINAMLHDE